MANASPNPVAFPGRRSADQTLLLFTSYQVCRQAARKPDTLLELFPSFFSRIPELLAGAGIEARQQGHGVADRVVGRVAYCPHFLLTAHLGKLPGKLVQRQPDLFEMAGTLDAVGSSE